MLTPAFELKQDDNFLTLIIKAPFAKVSETEIFIEENDFKFYSSPYYLRLTLPGNIVEDSREKADYDASAGIFTICVPKETPGEYFEGLDMLTKLLAPKGQRSAAPPLIQVIEPEAEVNDVQSERNDSAADGIQNEAEDEEETEKEFDWFVEQTPFIEQVSPLDAPKYGFANQKSGVFQRLQEELCGIVDVPDPDKLPAHDRRELKIKAENAKFDGDHYIADLYDDDMIKAVLSYKPPWTEELKKLKHGTLIDEVVTFTDEEREKMRNLPRKEYLLDEKEETLVYLGLVDIMYAYCYNHRTTEGDNNVESSWTISKLSSTLSWLEIFNSLQDVIVNNFRRSLCYPLYRHWQLSMEVLGDVREVIKLGQRRVLKSLLEVHSLLIDTESRYILNDLYITDYCVWIQSASETKIKSLAEALDKINITKEDIGFNLEELEREAAELYEDETVEDVTEDLQKLSVTNEGTSNSGNYKQSAKTGDLDSDDSESDYSDSDESDSDESSSSNSEDSRIEKDTVENRKNSRDEEDEVLDTAENKTVPSNNNNKTQKTASDEYFIANKCSSYQDTVVLCSCDAGERPLEESKEQNKLLEECVKIEQHRTDVTKEETDDKG